MENEYNVVDINGIEYTEIDRVNDNGRIYVLLSNLDNNKDFCIKLLINENGVEYLDALSDREEFHKAFKLFADAIMN